MSTTTLETACVRTRPGLNPNGYGRAYSKALKRMAPAHRWVWTQIYGPIPPGFIIRHRCDHPPCIRLDHLELEAATNG